MLNYVLFRVNPDIALICILIFLRIGLPIKKKKIMD